MGRVEDHGAIDRSDALSIDETAMACLVIGLFGAGPSLAPRKSLARSFGRLRSDGAGAFSQYHRREEVPRRTKLGEAVSILLRGCLIDAPGRAPLFG